MLYYTFIYDLDNILAILDTKDILLVRPADHRQQNEPVGSRLY